MCKYVSKNSAKICSPSPPPRNVRKHFLTRYPVKNGFQTYIFCSKVPSKCRKWVSETQISKHFPGEPSHYHWFLTVLVWCTWCTCVWFSFCVRMVSYRFFSQFFSKTNTIDDQMFVGVSKVNAFFAHFVRYWLESVQYWMWKCAVLKFDGYQNVCLSLVPL